MQSSIFMCLSQARINLEVAAGRTSGVKMGGDDGRGSLISLEGWLTAGLSVYLPLLSSLAPLKSRR